jgi:hypothetical protein
MEADENLHFEHHGDGMKPRIPTLFQGRTLEMLLEGWRLLREVNQLTRLGFAPVNMVDDIVECGNAGQKTYQMWYLEKYGWVVRTQTGWEITEEGKEAKSRYDAYYEKLRKKYGP